MIRSCTKSSNEVMSCRIKGKPLVLSWGRTPPLDSDVRRTSAVLRKRPLEAFRQSCYLRIVASCRRYTLDEETYPRFLHKNEKDMDLFAFIHAPDPTKVKNVERERVGDEPLFLQTTVGRTIPLLPVAHDRADSELETSIDKLFDEGGSGSQAVQGGSAGVGEGTNIQPVTEVTDIVTEDVAPL
nr:hypothetical protein [Tanacetum cinerariifolium]